MSVFSASGHLSPAQADEYVAALLHLLDTQNPLEVLRDTPSALVREMEAIPATYLNTPEAPGKWSAGMVFAHLADSELVGAFRLRMIMAQDRPTIAPYDQDRWAARLHYETSNIHQSLERFTVLRRANLPIWSSTASADLARVGLHGERGEESIERMRRLYAGHDLVHLRQLSRIRIVLTGR
jgi:DinB superfamily